VLSIASLTQLPNLKVKMGTDIRVQGLTKPVPVAEYLFTRLHQLGIRSIHGLPGDFNLVALDYIPKAKLKWVGSVNELNAGPPHPLFVPLPHTLT